MSAFKSVAAAVKHQWLCWGRPGLCQGDCVTVSLLGVSSCGSLLIYTFDFFFFSVQLVLQLPQHQIKANSPKKPWAINSDVADAALRDGGVSEELTELVSLLGDMSWVHLTCGVKPRSRSLTSALCRTCKRLNHRYNFIITLLISQLYSIGFLHARFRCM